MTMKLHLLPPEKVRWVASDTSALWLECNSCWHSTFFMIAASLHTKCRSTLPEPLTPASKRLFVATQLFPSPVSSPGFIDVLSTICGLRNKTHSQVERLLLSVSICLVKTRELPLPYFWLAYWPVGVLLLYLGVKSCSLSCTSQITGQTWFLFIAATSEIQRDTWILSAMWNPHINCVCITIL